MYQSWIGERSSESVESLKVFLDTFIGTSNWCASVEHADGARVLIVSSRSTDDLRASHARFREARSGDVDRDLADRPNALSDEENRVLNFAAPLGGAKRCYFTLAWDSEAGFERWAGEVHRLAETLCGLLQVALARRYEEILERALRTAVQRLDVGCIIATNGGEVLFANAAALSLCEASWPDGNGGEKAMTLSRFVKSAVHGTAAKANGGETLVHPLTLPGGDVCPAYVSPISIDDSGDEDKRWGYVVFVSRPEALADPQALEVALGLTRVEAKLTLEIAQGRSVSEAADALSIREQTARSYLKRIFSKLGVHRQSQLAAVATRLSVPLRRVPRARDA